MGVSGKLKEHFDKDHKNEKVLKPSVGETIKIFSDEVAQLLYWENKFDINHPDVLASISYWTEKMQWLDIEWKKRIENIIRWVADDYGKEEVA